MDKGIKVIEKDMRMKWWKRKLRKILEMKEEVMKVGIKIYEIVENIRKRGEIEMNESNREIR